MVEQKQNISILRKLFQEKQLLHVQATDDVDAVEYSSIVGSWMIIIL